MVMASGLVIDTGRGEVSFDGKPLGLLPTELRILLLLAGASGRVFSRREILDGLHGENYAITDRAVDVQVAGLRRKLGAAASRIETVRGVGFRFR
jgi:two-component system, OmpR family, alkaline phosphatase synthesis response regulator PhoP